MLGEEGSPQWNHAHGETSLILVNKFEVPEDEDHTIKALYVRTKRLVVDAIRFQQGNDLVEILDTPASEEEERMHMDRALEAAIAASTPRLPDCRACGPPGPTLRICMRGWRPRSKRTA